MLVAPTHTHIRTLLFPPSPPPPSPLADDRSFAFSNWTSFTPLSQSFMPHHRVHIIELSPSGKFNLRRSPRNFQRVAAAETVETRAYPVERDGWKRGYIIRFRSRMGRERNGSSCVSLFKEEKKGGEGKKKYRENRETNRENYIGIGSWIGMKTPRIVA